MVWEPSCGFRGVSSKALSNNAWSLTTARVVLAADEEAQDKTLVVQLDLSDFTAVKRLPVGYPTKLLRMEERAAWLADLVSWWQLPRS